MANLTKLEFIALHSSGKNYLSWVLDAEIHLDAMGLGDTIKEENKASKQNYARAMIFLRHHLDEILKIEYLTVKARYDWMHLRLQDFKSIYEYNSAMFKITSQLKLCGETNHENRPTGSEPLPEVNEAYVHHARHGKGRSPNLGRGRGRDYGQERNSFPGVNHLSNKNHNQKEKRKDEKREATWEGCFRCGGRGHYARDCRTPKHLVELYKKSLKKKVKNPEANFVSENQVDITHLDVEDFFTHPEGKIDHLIGDDSVNMKE
ncbi:uncharacterized protein LOC125817215 [Solanum verrucosum]|uniref:uncharacterized protein LOC125817215 n=1 Tax=Solanum verrucosum TaxID=315347 RepID=UPI0020D1B607|nr:uncharacterized protein LOC125817215 [Solanum verrucosum]